MNKVTLDILNSIPSRPPFMSPWMRCGEAFECRAVDRVEVVADLLVITPVGEVGVIRVDLQPQRALALSEYAVAVEKTIHLAEVST
jgi:hypothetical protein